jgi:hypothetical protein
MTFRPARLPNRRASLVFDLDAIVNEERGQQ